MLMCIQKEAWSLGVCRKQHWIGEGAEERTGTATMFRKMLPKDAIFSTVLSTIVVTVLNYLLHIFWLLFSSYSIGFLVILETNVTCISFKYIKRTPCFRPKFLPRFCVNLLCLLFTLLAAIDWQNVNLQNKKKREISRGVFQNRGVFEQAFPPLLLVHPSILHFFCFPSNSVTRLETLSDEG